MEAHAIAQAHTLLHRYGIGARELALLDPWMPPWRILYEVLSRMELAGDVRRGYFVEGCPGLNSPSPKRHKQLQDLHLPSTATAQLSCCTAKIRPTSMALESAIRHPTSRRAAGAAFSRRPGNWLVVRARQTGPARRTAWQTTDGVAKREPRGRGRSRGAPAGDAAPRSRLANTAQVGCRRMEWPSR